MKQTVEAEIGSAERQVKKRKIKAVVDDKAEKESEKVERPASSTSQPIWCLTC